jgi:hypothetical protein
MCPTSYRAGPQFAKTSYVRQRDWCLLALTTASAVEMCRSLTIKSWRLSAPAVRKYAAGLYAKYVMYVAELYVKYVMYVGILYAKYVMYGKFCNKIANFWS